MPAVQALNSNVFPIFALIVRFACPRCSSLMVHDGWVSLPLTVVFSTMFVCGGFGWCLPFAESVQVFVFLWDFSICAHPPCSGDFSMCARPMQPPRLHDHRL